jgi:hypothetical protein
MGFPFLMYFKVYKPAPVVRNLMWFLYFAMLAVSLAAAVAAFRSMVVAWGSVQFFS